jgi:phospholipase/carboxylesterase
VITRRVVLIASLGLAACSSLDEGPHLQPRSRERDRAPARDARTSRAPWGGLTVIERGDTSADAAFVLLHGYGAPGDDLVSLADELVARCGRPLRVIVPAAPIVRSGSGRAWYEIESRDAMTQAARAREAIEGVITTLGERGVPSERVIVGGFSQGGILSIETAVDGHARLAGIAVLSGRSLPHDDAAYGALRDLPVFQAHGRSDARIAFAEGEAFRETALRSGARVEPLVFEGGHTIPPEVVVGLAAWIARTLS